MRAIGGRTMRRLTTRLASRSNASLDMPTRKLTPVTSREASTSVSAMYRVDRAVPPGRTSAARLAKPFESLARSPGRRCHQGGSALRSRGPRPPCGRPSPQHHKFASDFFPGASRHRPVHRVDPRSPDLDQYLTRSRTRIGHVRQRRWRAVFVDGDCTHRALFSLCRVTATIRTRMWGHLAPSAALGPITPIIARQLDAIG
jgi:hypothetical protein